MSSPGWGQSSTLLQRKTENQSRVEKQEHLRSLVYIHTLFKMGFFVQFTKHLNLYLFIFRPKIEHDLHVGRLSFWISSSPSLRSGWLRCRSWQVRAGLSWVPRGKRMFSISCRSELREPKISSIPSLPIRNSFPVASEAGISGSFSGSNWLASMERFDFGLL